MPSVDDIQTHVRHVGDTRTPMGFALVRPDGTKVDLTGLTVKFKMKDPVRGTYKVAETETGVTVTDAANGEGQYDFSPTGVDLKGTYHAYVVAYDAGNESDHFPVASQRMVVRIDGD